MLLAQRPAGKAYAGYWEFPGGKLEPGETPRARARPRAAEELGIDGAPRRAVARAASSSIRTRTSSSTSSACSHGTASRSATTGRRSRGRRRDASTSRRCCRPTRACCARCCCRRSTASRMADEIGEAAFLARARAALDARACGSIQLREKDWPRARQRALAAALVALARPRGAQGAAERRAEDARAPGAATACTGRRRALAAATARPDDMLCAASCHTRAEIDARRRARARLRGAGSRAADADASGRGDARLGRLRGDRRGDAAAGLSRWADSRRPICAVAIAHGAHGVALRRAAWPADGRQPSRARRRRRGAAREFVGSGASAVGTR